MVRIEKFEWFYAKLRESANSPPLLIFDVDSICALNGITLFLISDSILFSYYPVSSFLEIIKYVGRRMCSSSGTPVTILLINWGCNRDLRVELNLGPADRVFVVDSHRPIHLNNLSDQNEQVIVLDDDDSDDVLKLAHENFHVPVGSGVADESDEEEEGSDEEEEGSHSESDDGNM